MTKIFFIKLLSLDSISFFYLAHKVPYKTVRAGGRDCPPGQSAEQASAMFRLKTDLSILSLIS